jgi:hypothetical protein
MEVKTLFLIVTCMGVIPGCLWADKDPCEVSSASVTVPRDATIIGECILTKLFLNPNRISAD